MGVVEVDRPVTSPRLGLHADAAIILSTFTRTVKDSLKYCSINSAPFKDVEAFLDAVEEAVRTGFGPDRRHLPRPIMLELTPAAVHDDGLRNNQALDDATRSMQ